MKIRSSSHSKNFYKPNQIQTNNYLSYNNDFSKPLNIINQKRKDIQNYKYLASRDKNNINEMLNSLKSEIIEITKNIKETDNKVEYFIKKHYSSDKNKPKNQNRNIFQYQSIFPNNSTTNIKTKHFRKEFNFENENNNSLPYKYPINAEKLINKYENIEYSNKNNNNLKNYKMNNYDNYNFNNYDNNYRKIQYDQTKYESTYPGKSNYNNEENFYNHKYQYMNEIIPKKIEHSKIEKKNNNIISEINTNKNIPSLNNNQILNNNIIEENYINNYSNTYYPNSLTNLELNNQLNNKNKSNSEYNDMKNKINNNENNLN